MKIVFSPTAMQQWLLWKSTSPVVCRRIKKLLEDIKLHPFTGLGKPEALKYELAGKWSRRINASHRLIYSVNADTLEAYILSMRTHYGDK